jgi:hypothetical protein
MADKTDKAEKPAKKKVYRKDTTEVHPLFNGNPEQYNKDLAARASIPKAKADR